MKNILSVLLVSVTCCAQAQNFQKGTWLIGLQSAYRLQSDDFFKHGAFVKAYGGYFISNKLLVGLTGTRSLQRAPISFKSTTYTVGPLLRYQLTQTRVSPYLMTSFQIGQRKSSGDWQFDNPNVGVINYSVQDRSLRYSRSLGMGLLISVVSGLKLEGSLIWQDFEGAPNLKLNLKDKTNYQVQVGATYQFGNR
jgi:hypothetical protein